MKIPCHYEVKRPHVQGTYYPEHSLYSAPTVMLTGWSLWFWSPLYNHTVVPLESQAAQEQAGAAHRAMSYFAVSSGFFGGQWHEIHPQYWTKYQVWEWLQHLLDTNQLDASCIPFQEFDISGEHLCSMSLQEFTRAAGNAGQLLYSNLQHLKWNGEWCWGAQGLHCWSGSL